MKQANLNNLVNLSVFKREASENSSLEIFWLPKFDKLKLDIFLKK